MTDEAIIQLVVAILPYASVTISIIALRKPIEFIVRALFEIFIKILF